MALFVVATVACSGGGSLTVSEWADRFCTQDTFEEVFEDDGRTNKEIREAINEYIDELTAEDTPQELVEFRSLLVEMLLFARAILEDLEDDEIFSPFSLLGIIIFADRSEEVESRIPDNVVAVLEEKGCLGDEDTQADGTDNSEEDAAGADDGVSTAEDAVTQVPGTPPTQLSVVASTSSLGDGNLVVSCEWWAEGTDVETRGTLVNRTGFHISAIEVGVTTVGEYISTTASPDRSAVLLNGEEWDFDTTRWTSMVDALEAERVQITGVILRWVDVPGRVEVEADVPCQEIARP